MVRSDEANRGADLFAGTGKMCALMRAYDWSQSLGPVETWPQSLRALVSIMLQSPDPAFIFWRGHLDPLYNDACCPLLGVNWPPQVPGLSGSNGWSETWETFGPLVDQVMARGEAICSKNMPLSVHRNGVLVEAYFTCFYSPIWGNPNTVSGVFCTCIETTQQVLGERRLRTLQDLVPQTEAANPTATACELAMDVLSRNPADIPFALLYITNGARRYAYLMGAIGIEPDTPVSPAWVDLHAPDEGVSWLMGQVLHTGIPQRLEGLTARFETLATGAETDAPHVALALPVTLPDQICPCGLLVVGINPRQILDSDYQGFLALVAKQLAWVTVCADETQTPFAGGRHDVEALSQQLTHVLEAMSDGFIVLDHDWRITYQNRASREINRKPPQQVLGKTPWEVWPACRGTELETQYQRAMAEQRSVHFEYVYREPSQEEIWLDIHAYPFSQGLSVFFRDITERKRTDATLLAHQAQLKQQLAEIETIYRSAPIGLNVLDCNLRFLRVNERLAEINGFSVEAHIGRSIRELLPDLADTAERLLFPILETGEPLLNVELSGETPAQPGVQRTWIESFLPLKDGDRIIGVSTVCEEVTERKRIEAARQKAEAELQQAKDELEQRVATRTAELRNSEATQRAILEAIPDLLIQVNREGIRLNFISGGEVRLHPAVKYDVPQSIYDTLPQELADLRMHYVRQALNTGQRQLYEHAIDIDGDLRFEETRVVKLNDQEVLLMVRDITDRKRSEAERQQAKEALSRREEQLRLTLEFTHIGTWDWDVLTGKTLWNDNHFRLLGLEPQSTSNLYQRWLQAIHPEDRERVEQALVDALHQHTDYEMEYRVLRPDGEIRWLVGKGRGLYDHNQFPIRMLGVILDVTERKQAEHKLELQAVVTRNMAEGICLVRADNGLIVYANPKFEQMFGYDPDELTGKHVSIVNYATDEVSAEEVNQAIRAMVLATREATYEVHNVKKDGTPFWCSATTSVFDHPDYGLVLVAVQQDISERKEAFYERERAEEKIRASLQEKELLLKEIYHRVKNNLQVIYSLLNLQSRHLTDAAAAAVLKDSQSRIRAMALVHEKLYQSHDLSRIDFADYVKSLAYGLLEFYRSDINYPDLKLDLESCLLDIEIAIPCGLILTELLSNSLKHAFPNHRQGAIQITSNLSSPNEIALTICDNGVGLPPGLNFKTVSSLGLKLVRNLTQQIKGQVIINAAVKGTAFELIVPVKKQYEKEGAGR